MGMQDLRFNDVSRMILYEYLVNTSNLEKNLGVRAISRLEVFIYRDFSKILTRRNL